MLCRSDLLSPESSRNVKAPRNVSSIEVDGLDIVVVGDARDIYIAWLTVREDPNSLIIHAFLHVLLLLLGQIACSVHNEKLDWWNTSLFVLFFVLFFAFLFCFFLLRLYNQSRGRFGVTDIYRLWRTKIKRTLSSTGKRHIMVLPYFMFSLCSLTALQAGTGRFHPNTQTTITADSSY